MPVWPYRINVLCSYAYLRPYDGQKFREALEYAPDINLLIDSGAFTNYWDGVKAAAKGKEHNPILIEEYLEAARLMDGNVWQYIMLDVPMNKEASDRNLRTMLDAGLTPMPVLVEGEEYSRMEELVEINERVCVAGAVRTGDLYIYQRYQKAYDASRGKAKIHGLGFGRWPDILSLPLSSADSSTSTNGARFGAVNTFDPELGLPAVRRPVFKLKRLPERAKRMVDMARRCNISLDDLQDNDNWVGAHSLQQFLTSFAFLQFMQYLRRVTGKDYFIVFPHLSQASYLLRINLAVMETAHDHGQAFDWQQAKPFADELKAMPNEQFKQEAHRILGAWKDVEEDED